MFTRVLRGIDYYSKSRVFTYVTDQFVLSPVCSNHVEFCEGIKAALYTYDEVEKRVHELFIR